MYAIVEFVVGEKRECALVPVLWLVDNNTICYWPRTKNEEHFLKLVKSKAIYQKTWPKYPVHNVLHTGESFDALQRTMTHIIEHGTSEEDGTVYTISKKSTGHCYETESQSNDEDEEGNDEAVVRENISKKRKHTKKSKKNKKKKVKRQRETSSDTADDTSSVDENSPPTHHPTSNPRQNFNISNASPVIVSVNETARPSAHSLTRSITEYDLSTSQTLASTSNLVAEAATVVASRNPLRPIDEKALQYLERIKSCVDQNQLMLRKIISRQQATNVDSVQRPEVFPTLPIETMEEFANLEELLKSNEHRIYLTQKLSSIGGTSGRQCVLAVLKSLLTNELAMQFNWAGRDKIAFQKTLVMQVIYDAVKATFHGKELVSDIKEANIAAAVKDWLKLARSRYSYVPKRRLQ
ncbi:uncharacterized protein [Neodiprion pinetum]|uniref:uncharacterized protein n=1 Tax=Neodiprion pinetum TaxID=441929 RepID=UPI0037108B40